MNALSMLLKNRKLGNKRGIAAIYVALILIVLVAFVGLAIDIGYMYVAKSQLQNAADSAAHAGASKLLATGGIISNLSDSRIPEAKTEAVNFALNNRATGKNIVILNDGTNVLSDTNDVTVGYWDGSSYTANALPVNALEARSRRTANSPGGKVAIFFGKAFGFSEMAASASAVAALPLRAGVYIAFCIETCTSCAGNTPCSYPDGKQYDTGPGEPYSDKFAWTTLLDDPTSASKLEDLICQDRPLNNVCNKQIYTTMGTAASDLKDFASAFYDTNYDVANKTFTTVNGQKVTTGWEVIVPITNPCPPGNQGKWDPKNVTNYAKVNVTAVCATGNKGCYGDLPKLNSACNNALLPRRNCCDNFANNSIVVDRVRCVSCSDQSLFSGTRPVIVK
jgi:Flp pilus assembly protein TadG